MKNVLSLVSLQEKALKYIFSHNDCGSNMADCRNILRHSRLKLWLWARVVMNWDRQPKWRSQKSKESLAVSAPDHLVKKLIHTPRRSHRKIWVVGIVIKDGFSMVCSKIFFCLLFLWKAGCQNPENCFWKISIMQLLAIRFVKRMSSEPFHGRYDYKKIFKFYLLSDAGSISSVTSNYRFSLK